MFKTHQFDNTKDFVAKIKEIHNSPNVSSVSFAIVERRIEDNEDTIQSYSTYYDDGEIGVFTEFGDDIGVLERVINNLMDYSEDEKEVFRTLCIFEWIK